MLAAWCTALKAWHEQPCQYESAWQAQAAATDRRIYRATYVREGGGSIWSRSSSWAGASHQPPRDGVPAESQARPYGD